MPDIRLIHWNAAEAAERAERLRRLGYEVSSDLPAGPDFLRQLRQEPPLAVVIDLSRLPSQGRDMGVQIRHAAATRRVPLVFVGGAPDKIAQAQAVLPDATFTTWERIGEDLAAAIRNPPAQPIVPESTMAGYSGRPLVKKLGIKPGMRIALFAPPEGFGDLVGELPPGATFQESSRRLMRIGDLVRAFPRRAGAQPDIDLRCRGRCAALDRLAEESVCPAQRCG